MVPVNTVLRGKRNEELAFRISVWIRGFGQKRIRTPHSQAKQRFPITVVYLWVLWCDRYFWGCDASSCYAAQSAQRLVLGHP